MTSCANHPATGSPANTERRYEVTRSELPLSCPSAAMAVWNSHPRVYLAFDEHGKTTCPYCGALYVLTD